MKKISSELLFFLFKLVLIILFFIETSLNSVSPEIIRGVQSLNSVNLAVIFPWLIVLLSYTALSIEYSSIAFSFKFLPVILTSSITQGVILEQLLKLLI